MIIDAQLLQAARALLATLVRLNRSATAGMVLLYLGTTDGATLSTTATALGFTEAETKQALQKLYRDGLVSGFALTDAGQVEATTLIMAMTTAG